MSLSEAADGAQVFESVTHMRNPQEVLVPGSWLGLVLAVVRYLGSEAVGERSINLSLSRSRSLCISLSLYLYNRLKQTLKQKISMATLLTLYETEKKVLLPKIFFQNYYLKTTKGEKSQFIEL